MRGGDVTTRIDLIRHGNHPLVGQVLCGRMPGVAIDAKGRSQMAQCAEQLARFGVDIVESSPQQRALQSADIIASRCGTAVELVSAVDEIEMGDWTGIAFAELARSASWQAWNRRRSLEQPPNGESAGSLQRRVVRHLEEIRLERSGARIAVVSHAELIRVALMHYLRIPLDDFQLLDVEPGSISTLFIQRSRTVVTRINGRALA